MPTSTSALSTPRFTSEAVPHTWAEKSGENSMGALTNIAWTINQLLFHYEKWDSIQEFRRNESLSRDELNEIVWRKLQSIITHAFEHVPFYKRLYTTAGIHPRDIRTPEDFISIPIITKEMIRENLEQMVAQGIDRNLLCESRTGGSTGEPLKVYHDANNREILSAVHARILRWWGLSPVVRAVHVWRMQDFSKPIIRDAKKSWCRRIFSQSPVTFNAINMSEEAMEKYARCLNEIRPHILIGYLGALDTLAEYIETKRFTLNTKLKAVWSTSAPLGIHQERRIERIYKAPVYDQYGSCEVPHLAAECRTKDGLHILADIRHIEFVNEQGIALTEPNATGDVVVTDLINYAAPLIRYRNGDRGSYKGKKCSCGNILPLMNRVTGRITDMILLPDGGRVAGDYFTTLFDPYVDEVRKFQVCQKTKNFICIKVVMGKPETFESLKAKLTKDLTKITRNQVELHFERVDHIEHDRGKYRYIISEVLQSDAVK
jgi:phenylacetate-CoA ligase